MKKYILLLILTFSLTHSQGVNTTLYGVFKDRGNANYSSCYGYNAPNGREYAVLGCYTGTSIIDITEKPIKEVSFIAGPQSLWREMKVYQNYAFVVTEGNGTGAGLQIIDLTKPDSAKLVKTFLPVINGRTLTTHHTVSIEGKYLYLNGSKPGTGGVVVLDLTDPINPITLGEYSGLYVHDCSIYNDTIYAAGIYGQGVDIIDATNKSNLKRVKLVTYAGAGTHNTDLTSDKKYILSTDEIGTQNILRIWNREDINNIELVATYHAKPNTIIHNAHVKGNYAFIAHYSEGLRIVDLADGKVPVEVASYDTYPGSANNYVGAWGAFPYFNSNKILISDMSAGLVVVEFDASKIKAARGIISLIDSVTNLPISDATVEIIENGNIFTSNSKGEVGLGFISDTVNLKIKKRVYWQGYEEINQKFVLSYNLPNKIAIKMKPLKTGKISGKIIDVLNNKPINEFALKISKTPLVAISDSSGNYNFPPLLAESTYTIVASNFGYSFDSITVKILDGQSLPINFNLKNEYYENFEYNFGWVVGSERDSGNYGIWSRARANSYSYIGTPAQPTNHTPGGVMALVTGGTSGTSTQNVDGRTTITSPTFNGSRISNSKSLRYWRWFFTSNNVAGQDSLIVQISNDDGIIWKNLEVVTSIENSWKEKVFLISSLPTLTSQMKIRFIAVDALPSSIVEAAIDDFSFDSKLTNVENEEVIPLKFSLAQNYPNPFNPNTKVKFSIPYSTDIKLIVVDILGREIIKLYDGRINSGVHTLNFSGEKLNSGIYFLKFVSKDYSETKKMLLVK